MRNLTFFFVSLIGLGLLLACNDTRSKTGAGFPQPSSPVLAPPVLEATFSSIRENIFLPRCSSCHSPKKPASRVPLDTRGDLLDSPRDLVLPGNPNESGLLIAVTRTDDQRMPPPKPGLLALSAREIQVIRDWIQNGAP